MSAEGAALQLLCRPFGPPMFAASTPSLRSGLFTAGPLGLNYKNYAALGVSPAGMTKSYFMKFSSSNPVVLISKEMVKRRMLSNSNGGRRDAGAPRKNYAGSGAPPMLIGQ